MGLNERLLEAAIMNELTRDKVPVTVALTNGFQATGVIAKYDTLVVVLANDAGQQIIYKHSISTITPHQELTSAKPKTI